MDSLAGRGKGCGGETALSPVAFEEDRSWHCLEPGTASPGLTETVPGVSFTHHQIFPEADMKKILAKLILLGVLAGIGCLVFKRFCCKDKCGCSEGKGA